MAKDHWQIYNWDAPAEVEITGNADTIAIEDVPEELVKTALKATRLIGDGLYGVDLKSYANKYYVIEVNDNPSIDTDVEDAVLKTKLYEAIMAVFLKRIRRKHGYA